MARGRSREVKGEGGYRARRRKIKEERRERERETQRVRSSVFQHSSKIAWQSQHKYFISNSSMFAEQPEPIRPMAIRRQVQKFTIKLFANI